MVKQGDALLQLLLNFASEYAIRRNQVNQEGLKLNGTHKHKIYANYVNIMGGSIYFKYLGRNITNQTSIQEEIKSRMKSGMLAVICCRTFCLSVCFPKI